MIATAKNRAPPAIVYLLALLIFFLPISPPTKVSSPRLRLIGILK
jgi:hypothetical protein